MLSPHKALSSRSARCGTSRMPLESYDLTDSMILDMSVWEKMQRGVHSHECENYRVGPWGVGAAVTFTECGL